MARLNPRLLSLVSPSMRFLRGLAGRVLPCGCLIGVYETYGGVVVATIDARSPDCSHPNHRLHEVLEMDQATLTPSPSVGVRPSSRM